MASKVKTSQSASTSRPATPSLPPASKKGFNFEKCDPCRKSKKGCDGNAPCQRCVARRIPEQCIRLWGREPPLREKDEIKKKEDDGDDNNETAKALGVKTRRARAIADAAAAHPLESADDDHEVLLDIPEATPETRDPSPASSDDESDTGGVGVTTRRSQAKADAAAEIAAYVAAREQTRQNKPQFVFKLPAALAQWDKDKCDRCRYPNNTKCDGKDPCDRCTKAKRPCVRQKGEEEFEKRRAREEELARWRWEREIKDARAKWVEDMEEKEEKRKEEKQKLQYDLSRALDVRRKATGATRKIAKEVKDAVNRLEELLRRRQEEEEGEVERERQDSMGTEEVGGDSSESEEEHDDDEDPEMSDAEESSLDDGYSTQATAELGDENQGSDDEEMTGA